ncbi:hypothetical protein ACQCSU_19360 [Pseudarthrobacter sp. O4]|uniref:hypothetical protein n=1 Tax=Pseudarthrobacter sp. O4 TaxID=3418417 RepID=UPI003CF9D175
MTELNPALETEAANEPTLDADTATDTDTDTDTATDTATATDPEMLETRVDWPSLPAGAAAQDPYVDALLERLGTLPGLPVAVHGEVFAGLHDDLLEALNEDVSGPINTAGDTAS